MDPSNPQQPNIAQDLPVQPLQLTQKPSVLKTVIVILTLIFLYPIGIILMAIWMKWPLWVKLVVGVLILPIVIGIFGILSAVVLISINPAEQFAKAQDAKRKSDVSAILQAINQYTIDNQGQLPQNITTSPKEISSTDVNLCIALLPKYMVALPSDPAINDGQPITECTSYTTGYHISADAGGKLTVIAPHTELSPPISQSN